MTRGFFLPVDDAPPPRASAVPRCGQCGLHKGCRSPKMKPTGEGRRKVLVIAEAPGENEDREGTQLVGKSGKRLRRSLAELGVDLDRDCWKTNALACHPAGRKLTDEQKKGMAVMCRPNVLKAIRELEPETIVLLGAVAVKSVIGHLWREDVGKISKWVGWRIPCQELNAWVCPTWHPSYLMREERPVLDLWFDKHLEAAFALEGVPWPCCGPPNYASKVSCIRSPSEAARRLRWMMKRGGPYAFDYETNMLKPDAPDARIVSCAVCWRGERTIAYPWHGEAVKATGELLAGFEQKLGWNAKFEERWTRREFGHGVNNWLHDGMEGAHVLDNRPGVTSCKFQAFVKLGQRPWDGTVGPYLKADGGSNEKNRIDQVELGALLRYNALDALIEWELAMKQREEMGYE